MLTAVALASGLAGEDALAQVPPFQCGPDCSQPGRYVLCNDNLDVSGAAAGGVVLENFLEAACASFPAPAASFQLTGFAAAFGSGDLVATLLELYPEEGNDTPGARIYETGVGIPASAADGFTGLFFNAQSLTDDFRVCLRQQIDDSGGNITGRPLLFDSDGVQGTNTVFLPSQGGWSASPAAGDFVLRAVVEYQDLTPWDPGGPCNQSGDAGVPNDAGNTNADGGVSPADGGPRADGGAELDGGDDEDGGVTKGDAGSGQGPPTITAISPDKGPTDSTVDVTVVGTNFQPGLDLMIGAIQANEVSVPGSTTILARIPSGISPGVYDVLVRNPDGQTAVLDDGYTVLGDTGGGAPVGEGCGCRTAGNSGSSGTWGLLLLLAGLFVLF